MNIAENLMRKVKEKDYNAIVGCIQSACEEVFGYKKIGECNEDSANDRRPLVSVEKIGSGITAVTITNVPGLMPKKGEKVFFKCVHYGSLSMENPEGIISHISYSGNQSNLKLKDVLSMPSVRFSGYGDRWWNGGDMFQAPSCFLEELKVPSYVLSLSEVGVDGFIKELKGK